MLQSKQTGPPGQDGKDGSDGTAGQFGQDGTDGQFGQDGQDGAQGPVGPPGTAGQAGQAGQGNTTCFSKICCLLNLFFKVVTRVCLACTEQAAWMEPLAHLVCLVNRVTTESLELLDRKEHRALPELVELPARLVVLDHRVLMVLQVCLIILSNKCMYITQY